MSRTTSPRKQINEHNKEGFNYPFATIEDEDLGMYDNLEPLDIPQAKSLPLGEFPRNIKRWIWSAPGENDGEPWDLLVELEPDSTYSGVRFAYYHAWCDYTGFDCQGGMDITVLDSIEMLLEYAMGNAAYDRYIQSTERAESW